MMHQQRQREQGSLAKRATLTVRYIIDDGASPPHVSRNEDCAIHEEWLY
jgi:hypothetical protein